VGEKRAIGTFKVKLDTQAASPAAEAAGVGRMAIDKQFEGGLVGRSRGEMMHHMTATQGSGVYVAIERFEGTLEGKTGTFALHHTGLMRRGRASLEVSVVPDSGTGELAGIGGTMQILIEGETHSYQLDYELPGRDP
jgi:hypothetical protein